VLSDVASNTLVAVSIISIVMNPVLYRTVTPVEAWTSRRRWLWRLMNPPDGHGQIGPRRRRENPRAIERSSWGTGRPAAP
jgi:hypothetical protein